MKKMSKLEINLLLDNILKKVVLYKKYIWKFEIVQILLSTVGRWNKFKAKYKIKYLIFV